MRNVFVVGCDCTREMRLAVDRNQTTALATIDTDIRGQSQKCSNGVREDDRVVEPKLYPMSFQVRRLLKVSAFKSLWESER